MKLWELLTSPITIGRREEKASWGPEPSIQFRDYTPTVNYSGNEAPRFSNGTVAGVVSSGMQVSSWLYASLTTKSRTFSSVPMVLERRTRKGWIRDTSGAPPELLRLLGQPNPHQTMQDLLEQMCLHRDIAGNAFLHRIKDSKGRVLQLWTVDPSYIRPIRGTTTADFNPGYVYRASDGKEIKLSPGVIAQWMYQNPADARWGISPLKALTMAVDTDLAAQFWNRTTLRSGARPLGLVQLDTELNEDQQRLAYEQLKEQLSGPTNARHFMVLSNTSKVTPFGFSANEMDYLAGRKETRREIAAVLGVPAIILTQGEDATQANLDAARKQFWTETLLPDLKDVAGMLSRALLADFGLDAGHWRIVPDLSDVGALRENEAVRIGNLQKQAAAVAQLVNSGNFTPESIAEVIGLPLVTVQQQAAVQALRSLSPPTRKHIEEKHAAFLHDRRAESISELSPAESLELIHELSTGGET